jgi:2-methylcitrate dehydratase PrpD
MTGWVSALGHMVSSTPFEALSPNAIERAKVSLIHNLVVGLAGRSRERICHELAERVYAVPAEATLLQNGRRVNAEGAAFANAALLHSRSQDDTHPASTSHPGSPVMAAAFAMAELQAANGNELLAAIIVGYEALALIGNDVDEAITARGFRAAPVLGVFGAAAASARLMRLDPEQTGHALALASHLAGGLAQVWQEGSAEWPLQLGFSARNGILAARAAAAGATGAHAALEGKRGFFNAYAGMQLPGLPERAASWQIESATVKPYPACAILQGPLALLSQMLTDHEIQVQTVRRITLTLSPYEVAYPGVNNAGPISGATAAKMSAHFCLANFLVKRRLAMSDLDDWGDDAVAALADRIFVQANPGFSDRLCRLQIDLDHASISGELDRPAGMPSVAEITQFAESMAGEAGVAPSDMRRWVARLTAIESEADIGILLADGLRRP